LKVLAVSWYSPTLGESGELIRFREMCTEISKVHNLTVVSVDPRKGAGTVGEWVELKTPISKRYKYSFFDKVLSIIRGKSLQESVLQSKQNARFVADQIARIKPDIIYINQLPPISLLPGKSLHLAVVDTHNAETLRLHRRSKSSSNCVMARLLKLQADQARAFEERLSQSCAAVIAVSDSDADFFRSVGARHVIVAPNGARTFHRRAMSHLSSKQNLNLLFVGSLTYSANRQALTSFAKHWCSSNSKNWKIRIVGSGDPGPKLKKLLSQPRITLVGKVEDLQTEYEIADAVVIPMFEGGGTRLKVLEAAAFSVPIIATTVAVEGTGFEPGVHYYQANDEREFSLALELLRKTPQSADRLVQRAFDKTLESFNWEVIGRHLAESLTKVLTSEKLGRLD
jgi:glycosyltransferase involved in cell wall biosynthesis